MCQALSSINRGARGERRGGIALAFAAGENGQRRSMTKITDRYEQSAAPMFICDFSPPRGGGPELLEPAAGIDADWISVAYNPGRSTRVSPPIAAHWIKEHTGRDVVFTLATRDMNKIAIQSLLLGAQLMGLENVVVVQGDRLTERDLSRVRDASDYRPTELLGAIREMNRGIDFKGLRLRSPTDFCVGASLDLGRGVEREVQLAMRKVEAGAQFFISQPTFDPAGALELLDRYAEESGERLSAPVFLGVQVMTTEGPVFGDVPEWVTDGLAKGRSGVDIALEVLGRFTQAGFRAFYLIPPILKGGRRDYEAAQAVLEAFRR